MLRHAGVSALIRAGDTRVLRASEDSRADADCNVVRPGTGQLVEAQREALVAWRAERARATQLRAP